ncbi:hypothetical protein JRI60_22095 [Archangium violaceum]|uniref:hypothetical protein n=1 Tax=Archangium violaceum TaxID=83451 RepID=UPI0019519990|nr:hypothetical protein [Archangium violaceum]QRO01516.1 hypothetical protein JRI60_22095 [Archangium violaceum]
MRNEAYSATASEVGPDVYRLWGFLDANGDADLTVDVLAQPGAGDWVPESSVELNVQPGQVLAVDLALPRRVLRPLPAFQVVEQGEGSVLTLTDSATAITSFSVKSEGFGLLRGEAHRRARARQDDVERGGHLLGHPHRDGRRYLRQRVA